MIEGLLGPSPSFRLGAYPKLIKHYVFKISYNICIEDVDDMHSGVLCGQVLACLLVKYWPVC